MSFSTSGPLWLDRLSMTTTSPFESVGARHFSTHSSNEAALIGRSKAFCATRPERQASDKRDRFVMAMGNGGAQPSTAPTASAVARHVGGGPGLVDEHQLRRIEVELPHEPSLALRQNVRASLFLGMSGLLWNGPPLLPAS